MHALKKMKYGIFILMGFSIFFTNCKESSIATDVELEISPFDNRFQEVVVNFLDIGKKYSPKLSKVTVQESFLAAVNNGEPADQNDIDQVLLHAGIKKEDFFRDMKILETKTQAWLELEEVKPAKISLSKIEFAVQQFFDDHPDMYSSPFQSLLLDNEESGRLEARQDCKLTCKRKFNNCIVNKTALGIFKMIGCGIGAFSATAGTIEICLGCGGTIVWGLCAPTVSIIYGTDLVDCAYSNKLCEDKCN